MIETRRLKNVIFIETILRSFVLLRKTNNDTFPMCSIRKQPPSMKLTL